MRSKFISLILAIAVVMAMVSVPVALPGVAMASGNVTVAIEDATTYALPSGTFTIDAVVNNPSGMEVAGFGIRLSFDTSYFTVTAVTKGDFPEDMGVPVIDNTAGTIQWDPKTALGTSINGTHLVGAHINCTAKLLEGVSTVDYRYTTGPPPAYTKVVFGTTDYLEAGNMSLMLSGTVIIGSPKLTVDVSPAGMGDVEINAVAPGSYPDESSWAWDEVVDLEAIDSVAGWAFDSWSGNLTGITNPTSITMNTLTKSVTANFVEMPAILDVDPNALDLDARWGGFEANDTVTISNVGGNTLCWSLGDPPTWGIGDWWNYYNYYQPFSPAWASLVPGSNASFVNVSVVGGGSGSDYAANVNIAPALQRAMMGGMPCVLYSGTATFDEYTLDLVAQIGIMGIWPYAGGGDFTEVPVQANLTWAYDSCHGWPYYMYKSWSYNLTMDVRTVGTWALVDYKVIPAHAMVTNVSQTAGGFSDCYEITHFLTSPTVDAFMQTWWSPTAKNFVQQADGGTYDYPPMDVRSLVGFSTAAPPAGPAAWLSFDKTHGALGISGSEDLTVTANTSGLAVGSYSGSFTISAPGTIQSETVTVDFEVKPATTIEVMRDLPADALDYDAEYPGDTFWVYVNFTAPVGEFNSIGLTDYAPAGWVVDTDDAWCLPAASWNKSNYNKAEYAWSGPYDAAQTFRAKYMVTIPATASPGLNNWPNCVISNAWVEYWFGAEGPYASCIKGEYQKIVTVPGCVVGETRDVNADPLDTVTVVLYEEAMDLEDSDSSTMTMYKNCADDTGLYWQRASKYCYYTIDTNAMSSPRNLNHPDDIDFSTPLLLSLGYTMDFEGDYGLVCKAASMSYAMESVNHWLFVPVDSLDSNPVTRVHPEWQLHSWKAMESIHSWQFPSGCACC